MRIRTLGADGRDEREALLELLDGWPFDDDRRGRDFFRRYLELDPSFAPENVWIAEAAGRLVACVQIFPRRLRVQTVAKGGDQTLDAGGLGSVFTAPEHRRRGLGKRLLEAAVQQMVERGMVLSLLLATRLDWYRRVGFEPWHDERWRLVAGEAGGRRRAEGVTIEDFVVDRDLAAVRAIGDRYGSRRPGTLARSAAAWRASLDLAGDPEETFTVARGGERVVAYLRLAELDGRWQALEWGREADSADALAALLAEAVVSPAAPGDRGAGLPPLQDPDLEEALAARGLALERERWTGSGPPPTWMLRCLAPRALALRLGLEAPAEGPATELLQRVLPRERFCFWPADRF